MNSRDSVILSSLLDCHGDIQLQCDLLPLTSSPARLGAATHTSLEAQHSSSKRAAYLSITVFGLLARASEIGDYLQSCECYLQQPERARRNTPYINPQSLSVDLADAPMVFDLQHRSQNAPRYDEQASSDPSTQLEIDHDLGEIATPPGIIADLYL